LYSNESSPLGTGTLFEVRNEFCVQKGEEPEVCYMDVSLSEIDHRVLKWITIEEMNPCNPDFRNAARDPMLWDNLLIKHETF